MTTALLFIALVAGVQTDPEALSQKAAALAQEGKHDDAAVLWQRALRMQPRFFPALFNLGYMQFTRSRFAEAREFLARASEVMPEDFNTRYLLGAALVHLGRREDGLREWRKALAIQPRNLKLLEIMAVEYGNGQYFAESAAAARRALEINPDDPNVYFIAIKACQDAHDPEAAEIARRAVERFPDSARANFEYAYHLRKLGRNEKSIPYLKKAMQADPKYEEPFFFYGELMVQEERYEEAIPYLRQALRNRPDYVAATVALAKALMAIERYQDAVGELDAALKLQPKHPQPRLLLSQVYFRMGDEKRAREEKEISLRLRRADPTIMETPQGRPFPQNAR